MTSERLFYEDGNDAISYAISVSGKTMKQVALHLWPSLAADTAKARLSSALSTSGTAKLEFSEVIEICRFTGRPDPLLYFADEISYGRPAPKAPADEQAALMQQFQNSLGEMRTIAARLERLSDRTK